MLPYVALASCSQIHFLNLMVCFNFRMDRFQKLAIKQLLAFRTDSSIAAIDLPSGVSIQSVPNNPIVYVAKHTELFRSLNSKSPETIECPERCTRAIIAWASCANSVFLDSMLNNPICKQVERQWVWCLFF